MNCPLALLPEWLDGIQGTIFWELGKFSFGQKKMPRKSNPRARQHEHLHFLGVYLSCSYFLLLANVLCFKKSVQRIRYTTCDLTFLDSSPSPKKNITLPATGNTTRPGLQESFSQPSKPEVFGWWFGRTFRIGFWWQVQVRYVRLFRRVGGSVEGEVHRKVDELLKLLCISLGNSTPPPPPPKKKTKHLFSMGLETFYWMQFGLQSFVSEKSVG